MASSPTSKAFLRRVGQAVGTVRRRHGWSQEALALRLGMTAKAIAKFESGTFDLRLSTIHKLADALGVTPGQLLDTVPDGADGRTVRHRGPLQGLARTGWTRVPPHTPTALPILDLRPRAGRGPHLADPLVIGWAAPPQGRHPAGEGLFLAQVQGDSMTPQIRDGAWCLFVPPVGGDDLLGRVVLVAERDAAGLTAWSVKKATGLHLLDDGARAIDLASSNPAYPLRQVRLDPREDTRIDAVLREVLGPRLPSGRRRRTLATG